MARVANDKPEIRSEPKKSSASFFLELLSSLGILLFKDEIWKSAKEEKEKGENEVARCHEMLIKILWKNLCR